MRSLLLFIILFATFSCIDPIDLAVEGASGQLVVDGLITNQNERYKVKLSRSLKFDNNGVQTTYFVAERNATVMLVSDANETITLHEGLSGVYSTDTLAILGEIGRSYFVRINTSDGGQYESVPEKMVATPPIDDIGFELFIKEKISPTSGNVLKQYLFQVYAVTSDPASEQNFYRWKSTGIIEYHSSTDNPAIQTCWVSAGRLETQVEIADDRFTNSSRFSQPVAVAPFERPSRFQVKLEQHSLTKEAYEFWRALQEQQQNTGGIFDPPPAQIKGNLHSLTDERETILGYFGASAVTKKAQVFRRDLASDFMEPPNAKPILPGDCRNHEFGSTNVRPEGF